MNSGPAESDPISPHCQIKSLFSILLSISAPTEYEPISSLSNSIGMIPFPLAYFQLIVRSCHCFPILYTSYRSRSQQMMVLFSLSHSQLTIRITSLFSELLSISQPADDNAILLSYDLNSLSDSIAISCPLYLLSTMGPAESDHISSLSDKIVVPRRPTNLADSRG